MRDEPWRPCIHYTPARNWVNDPNGLVRLDGEYHLFYQYNPFGERWGHMSWGHAVGSDIVDWHELPVAIPEDERVSIYSGSVVVDHRNTSGFGAPGQVPLVAVYTGCLRRPEGGQAQELAYSVDRGRTWTKYAGNPVLDLGLRDFRDPKVFWHDESGRWVMVVVVPDARSARIYGSPDLKTWTLLSEFASPFEGEGIWECPDLIPFDLAGEGRIWMLKVDVFGGHPSGGTGARIFFGRFDGATFTPEAEAGPRWADQGADFYAALSFANLEPGDAPVWLAWMSCHRYAQDVPTAPWRGAMTLPRRLALRRVDGRIELLQQPVAALERLRGAVVEVAGAMIGGAGADLLPAEFDDAALEIELTIASTNATTCGVAIECGDSRVLVGYDRERGAVFVDRSASGWSPAGDELWGRRRHAACAAPTPARPLRLRLWIDRSSVEVFAGDGEAVLTELMFPPAGRRRLRLISAGGPTGFGPTLVWPLRPARID